MTTTYTIKYTRIYTRDIVATSPQTAKDRFIHLEREDRLQGIHKFDRLSKYQQVQIQGIV